jgi:PIN domain nuclease of toxin-antitoxin system
MAWVLDCSLALAWALPDEKSRRADQFLVRVSRDSDIWVPALWWYEMANALADGTTPTKAARGRQHTLG